MKEPKYEYKRARFCPSWNPDSTTQVEGIITLLMTVRDLTHPRKLVGAEIGVFAGEASVMFLASGMFKNFYLIDPYNHYKKQKKLAHIRLKKYKAAHWMEMTSDMAAKIIPQELDYVYVDGDHNHPAPANDIHNFTKLLVKGGILAGHDYRGWGGVKRAVNKIIGNENIKRYKDGSWLTVWTGDSYVHPQRATAKKLQGENIERGSEAVVGEEKILSLIEKNAINISMCIKAIKRIAPYLQKTERATKDL